MKKKILVFGVLIAAVKATQVLGLIRRSSKIKSIDALVFLYKDACLTPSRILCASLEPLPGKGY